VPESSVQVFVFARGRSAPAVQESRRKPVKSPAIDPFSGAARAAATHTIQSRHAQEIHGTARISFSRAVHGFRDFSRRLVISN